MLAYVAVMRANGVIAGLVASWIKAWTEPRLQAVAERILPPSPDQKQDVGADISGHPENMPPAVLVDRVTVALGHRLTVPQRLRAQHVIHYGTGAGLGVAYSGRREPLAGGEPRAGRAGGARDLRGHPRLCPPGARHPAPAVATGPGGGRVGVDVALGVRRRPRSRAVRAASAAVSDAAHDQPREGTDVADRARR